MPSPTASRCRPDNPVRCAWRASVPHDVLRFSVEARGWVLWLGREPCYVSACPGCGGTLPLMGSPEQTRTWLKDTLGDPLE
jgi:hypothetical protein